MIKQFPSDEYRQNAALSRSDIFCMSNRSVTIDMDRLEVLLDYETRIHIAMTLIENDNSHYIDTDELRPILGMGKRKEQGNADSDKSDK